MRPPQAARVIEKSGAADQIVHLAIEVTSLQPLLRERLKRRRTKPLLRRELVFIVPGRLDQLTGGYLSDRHIVEGLRARPGRSGH